MPCTNDRFVLPFIRIDARVIKQIARDVLAKKLIVRNVRVQRPYPLNHRALFGFTPYKCRAVVPPLQNVIDMVEAQITSLLLGPMTLKTILGQNRPHGCFEELEVLPPRRRDNRA